MRRAHGRNPRYRVIGSPMVNFKFGINFEFNRDKSVDKLVKEHEAKLQKYEEEFSLITKIEQEGEDADKTS
jgi:hypothetical protein